MRKSHNKSLNCKICGNEVKNVGSEATKVTCWECVNKMMVTGVAPADEDDDADRIDQD